MKDPDERKEDKPWTVKNVSKPVTEKGMESPNIKRTLITSIMTLTAQIKSCIKKQTLQPGRHTNGK